jgi:hypothetical protein
MFLSLREERIDGRNVWTLYLNHYRQGWNASRSIPRVSSQPLEQFDYKPLANLCGSALLERWAKQQDILKGSSSGNF